MKKTFITSSIIYGLIFAFCFTALSQAQGKVTLVGSIKSNKYHYSTCRFVKKIDKIYLKIFSTPEEAIKLGYAPCKICKPPIKLEKGING